MSNPVPERSTNLAVYPHYAIDALLHEPDVHLDDIPEAVIQTIWQQQYLTGPAFKTTKGQSLTVLHPGVLNTDQGPDFSQARLAFDGLRWSGDVEIHRTSADWVRHGHAADPHYNRVVLHVTLLPDLFTGKLIRDDGTTLPELVLAPYLNAPLRHMLHQFFAHPTDPFPCARLWPSVSPSLRASSLLTLGMTHTQNRVNQLKTNFQRLPNLDALLYTLICRTLGYAKNSEAMEQLAHRLPLEEARRYTSVEDLEALYLGMAGLLPDPVNLPPLEHTYVTQLQKTFAKRRLECSASPMPTTTWRFFRLRPANFPTLRLAQLASLIAPGGLLHHDPIGQLYAACTDTSPLSALRRCFQIQASPFWQSHVRLERPLHRNHSAALGQHRIDQLLTHAVLPVLFCYADQSEDLSLQGKLWTLYTRIPARSDEVTRRYTKGQDAPRHALEAQGIHALHKAYCTQGRCLDCPIGKHILQRPP